MVKVKNWYAVYTKPRTEKKVAELLQKKDIDTYCPLNRVLRQWSDRKKMVYEPLFSCYVFVQINTEEAIRVKETDGVLRFVSWLNKPAVIRDSEIETIKKFLNEHTNVQLEPIEVKVKDVIRIINGPLMEYEGNILSVKKNKVKVSLPSLGYMIVAEVDKTNVEVLKPFDPSAVNNGRVPHSKP